MFDSFRSLNNNVLYVQIWENRLRVTNINSKDYFDEKPLIAITRDSKNKKVIKAVGNNAAGLEDASTQVTNPFSHPRMLIADFVLAEKVLQHAILSIPGKKKLLQPGPVVVIHPMEKIEGGLSELEMRILKELAMGAGARKAYVHLGMALSTANFDLKVVAQNDASSPSRGGRTIWPSLVIIMLILAISYWRR